MNGFDRVVEGEDNWFHGHRSLPPIPEQYTASLKSELQKLKNAISMPAETETRPWQKTMDFVDGLKGKLPDEELTMINGAPFSYRNKTPHLYENFLLRFVKWLLRAYKYRQLRP